MRNARHQTVCFRISCDECKINKQFTEDRSKEAHPGKESQQVRFFAVPQVSSGGGPLRQAALVPWAEGLPRQAGQCAPRRARRARSNRAGSRASEGLRRGSRARMVPRSSSTRRRDRPRLGRPARPVSEPQVPCPLFLLCLKHLGTSESQLLFKPVGFSSVG